MIRDQRSLTGRVFHRTVGDVEAAWAAQEQAAARDRLFGWEGRTRFLPVDETLPAYVSDNRWVADCPACNGGIACWSENPRGACYDCGRIYRIRFPDNREAIEAVLAARPVQRRHWLLGETVDMLKAENIEHGLPVTVDPQSGPRSGAVERGS